jgi:hypothetical protein
MRRHGVLIAQFFNRSLTMSLKVSFDETMGEKLYFSRAYGTFREPEKNGHFTKNCSKNRNNNV